MKKIVFATLMGVLFLCISGCYKYVAEHPEKSEAQFHEDQSECEKIARDIAKERGQDWGRPEDTTYWRCVSDSEVDTSRRCMRDKGWNYHFRK
jgi:flagellar motility protein MotE (MotC chaperone)